MTPERLAAIRDEYDAVQWRNATFDAAIDAVPTNLMYSTARRTRAKLDTHPSAGIAQRFHDNAVEYIGELLDEIDRLRATYEPVHEPMDFVNPAEIAAVRLWNERKLREAQSPDPIE